MKIPAKIETYFKMIEGINYNNANGGAYAYVQFLAYNRELLNLLKPHKNVERQCDSLEGVSWLFNECLSASFTHRQKAIFENKLSEVKEIFEAIRESFKDQVVRKTWRGVTYTQRQAA